MRVFVLMLLVSGCATDGGEAVISDVSDSGAPMVNATVDGGESPIPDAAVPADTSEPDAGMLIDAGPGITPGECRPERDGPGGVSSADCRPLVDAPVCDAIHRRCAPEPTAICDACATQEQCDNAQPGSQCLTISGTVSDRACLWPCSEDTECVFLAEEWDVPVTRVRCIDRFCLQDIAEPNCRSTQGGRITDGF